MYEAFMLLLVLGAGPAPSDEDVGALVLSSASEVEITRAIAECADEEFHMYEPDPELHGPDAKEMAQLSPIEAIARVRAGAGLSDDAPARELLLAWLQSCARYRGSEAFERQGQVHTERLLRANRLAPDNRAVATAAARYVQRYGWGLSTEGRFSRLDGVRPADIGLFWKAKALGESPEALAAYQRSLELHESDEVRIWYAATLAKSARAREALEQLEKVPEAVDRKRAVYWRATALLALSRPSEARALLAKAYPTPGSREDDWVMTEGGSVVEGYLGCVRGASEEALGNLDEAENWYRSSPCEESLPRLLHKRGRWFDALLAFGEEGGRVEDLDRKLECLLKLGASEAARELVESASAWCESGNQDSSHGREMCDWSGRARERVPAATRRIDDAAALTRLERPREAYAEAPLPKNASASTLLAPLPRNLLPPDVSERAVVYSGRDGKRRVVVTVRRDLDPAGEASPGGYWVHLSTDDGRSWRGPLYTGLTARFPYVIRKQSHRTPFEKDDLRLEVDVREIDPESITFPPVALRLKRSADDVVLRIPIARLTADADADGLTDLYEAKIATDPNAADTDGDGRRDGEDPLPLTSSRGEASEEDTLVMLALQKTLGGDRGALVTAPGAAIADFASPATYATPVLFVRSDRERFVGTSPGVRTILLTRAMVDAIRKKYGPALYPVHIGAIVWNEDHTRAFFHYTFGWRGGGYLFTRTGDSWTFVEIDTWIS